MTGIDPFHSPAMTRPKLSNHIEFRHGPIHCTIETWDPLPANLWSWVGELSECAERVAQVIADHDAHMETKRQMEYEARLAAETKKNTELFSEDERTGQWESDAD